MSTLKTLSRDLAGGAVTSTRLVDDALARIADPSGEGLRAFIALHEARARETAASVDRLRALGTRLPPFAGIPIAIKDLFDEAGVTTTSGSLRLRDAPPAAIDAPAIAHLRAAGFIILGRNNQTEFAFSGIGFNPHHGTPLNPWDRATGRVPGGSSSGAAVAVADGLAFGAIGSDTGGSCRVPAAFCGIVGLKPTSTRISRQGVLPLSPTLDTVGPLANTVACCRTLFEVMSGRSPSDDEIDVLPLDGLRLGVPTTVMLDGLDPRVAQGFEAALRLLSQKGARVSEFAYPLLADLSALGVKGGLSSAESYAWHRRHGLFDREADYDPRVLVRMKRGAAQEAADYLDLLATRERMIGDDRHAQSPAARYDALLMPTAPIVAPTLSEIGDDERFHRLNILSLRNTSPANLLDRCAISIPCHEPGTAPVGLMVMGEHDGDERLLSIAAAIEAAVRPG